MGMEWFLSHCPLCRSARKTGDSRRMTETTERGIEKYPFRIFIDEMLRRDEKKE
jgi:hypothetical protein